MLRMRLSLAPPLVTLMVFAGVAMAQATPARQPAMVAPQNIQRLQDAVAGLDLTDDQKVQFQALKDKVAQTVREMAGELKDLPPAERREKLAAALGDVRGDLQSILTPEQKRQLKQRARDRRIPGRRPLKDLQADAKDTKKAAAPDADPTPTPARKAKEAKADVADPPLLARIRQAVNALDLTAEQKTQTDQILNNAQAQAKQIRQNAAGDREAAREKVTALTQSVRTQLAAVLTAEQKQKLADSMPGGRGGIRARDANPPTSKPADTKTPDPSAAKAAAASSQPVALAAGAPAPAFSLKRLNGNDVSNKTFAGRPLVVVFGSLTSPAFRDRLPKLEALKNKYRSRAGVLIIYTREAHPADGWQVARNRDDKLEINRPTTADERKALAVQLRDRAPLTVDIAVDTMDDATTAAFGDTPDGAVVISPRGSVIGTQTHCDPSGLPRLIELALTAKD